MSHVDSYGQGETRFSLKRQEAVEHLHQIRARLQEVHVRTMSVDGGMESGNMLIAQAALDDAMNVEEQDLSEEQADLAQVKEH